MQLQFDANQVEPSTPFESLPKGKYLAVAVQTEMKDTKKNDGQYLQVTFEVIDGPFKGRKIFDRMNIRNINKQAEDIARRSLSGLCRAVGVMILNDSEQLHNIPLYLDLVIEADTTGKYQDLKQSQRI